MLSQGCNNDKTKALTLGSQLTRQQPRYSVVAIQCNKCHDGEIRGGSGSLQEGDLPLELKEGFLEEVVVQPGLENEHQLVG